MSNHRGGRKTSQINDNIPQHKASKIHIHHFYVQTHTKTKIKTIILQTSIKSFKEYALIVPLKAMSKLSSAKAVDTKDHSLKGRPAIASTFQIVC